MKKIFNHIRPIFINIVGATLVVALNPIINTLLSESGFIGLNGLC